MSNANNINTGLASKIESFKWLPNGSTIQYKTMEPDYSIPPTPASSYANLHVILDTVHPSVETITHGVLPQGPCLHASSQPVFIEQSGLNTQIPVQQPYLARDSSSVQRSLSPLPQQTSVERSLTKENRLDDVPQWNLKAVLEPVNPEQPGARASEALTSLKSEIAPIQPPIVPLEEFDDMAERTDRQLPESVDLSLVDETSNMDNQWHLVGDDIKHKGWQLRHVELPTINSWAIIGKMENNERRWRMSRGIDAVWSGRIHLVGSELMTSVAPIGWSLWFSNLRNKVANKSNEIARSVSDSVEFAEDVAEVMKDTAVEKASDLMVKGADLLESAKDTAKDIAKDSIEIAEEVADVLASKGADLIDSVKGTIANVAASMVPEPAVVVRSKPVFSTYTKPVDTFSEIYIVSLPRRVPAYIIALEEKERQWRMHHGVSPVVSGLWHQLGRELKHSIGADFAAWFSGLKFNLAKKRNQLVSSAKGAIDSYNTIKAPRSAAVSQLGSYEFIDFTFNHRTPAYIWALEEEERQWRLSHGINPVVSGLWYRLGLELKHKFSLRPTIASTTKQVIGAAADLADQASTLIGGLAWKAEGAIEDAIESGRTLWKSATPAPAVEFANADHPLNLFAYTAEPIDFTFKSRRCPQWIIDMEEAERSDRIARGVDVVAYGKWNALLSQSHKTLTLEVPSMMTSAKEALVESSKGFGGFLSSWVHSVADIPSHLLDAAKHSHFAESAKDAFDAYYDAGSIAALNKSEEAERVRRMGSKVDPMTAARLGRVQEELLHTIKSV